jgi:alpha-D-xyloside xylohydrolase
MGVYSLISFHWDNAQKSLTVNDRKGEFPGMLINRTFNIVLVNENKGQGVETNEIPAKTVHYNGHKVMEKF